MQRTQELKSFEYVGKSHVGNLRAENQDAINYRETINGSFFVLCDGMGGIAGGKQAANAAVEAALWFADEHWEENPVRFLQEMFSYINKKLNDAFKNIAVKPGTTMAALLIRNDKVYYAHAGDSRIYYSTGDRIFCLTKDHSYVQNLIDQKKTTPEEALKHPRRNEITQAIGIQPEIFPEICSKEIMPADGDYIFLCTDGFYNELPEQKIKETLKIEERSLEHKANVLLDTILDGNAPDNISFQLIHFYNTGKENTENQNPIVDIPGKRKKRSFKKAIIFFLVFLALAIFVIFTRSQIQSNINQIFEPKVIAHSLVYVHREQDTIIEKYFPKTIPDRQIRKQFYLRSHELGQRQFEGYPSMKIYYFPIQNMYTQRTGKSLLTYPEITLDKTDKILITNNKKYLFFKPGEKIIIPK